MPAASDTDGRAGRHEQFMAQALELARRGDYRTAPNPRVGCVLVRDDRVIGQGWHEYAGGPHAEVNALEDARNAGGAAGAQAYVTLEPCCHQGRTPPCTQALIEAGVATVYIGMQDPNPQVAGNGMAELEAAGIGVVTGVLAEDCAAVNRGFSMRMRHGRPWVRLKLAMTLDGRTAAASGQSQWITGAQAREDVHRLRGAADVIVTGVGTVLADDPSLNVRLPGDWPTPIRVVLDSRLRMPPDAKMLGIAGRTMVFTTIDDDTHRDPLAQAGAEITVLSGAGDRVDLQAAMRELGQAQINSVLAECGPTLGGALLAAGLVDELVVYMAPSLLGDSARGLVTLPGAQQLNDRIHLDIREIRALGSDWRITAVPLRRDANSQNQER